MQVCDCGKATFWREKKTDKDDNVIIANDSEYLAQAQQLCCWCLRIVLVTPLELSYAVTSKFSGYF